MTRKLLDAVIIAVAVSVLLILALGGVDYDWGIFRLRLHALVRPLALLTVLVALRVWFFRISTGWMITRSLLAILLTAFAVYATYQVRVCGGLDSYGYVSASKLIASGRLTEPQPLAQYLPFSEASAAAAPLGYVPGPDGHTSVPRFPLGLPVVMALFRIFGEAGPFYVPLVMAFITCALAFLLVRRALPGHERQSAIALFAAVVVAIDPLLVYYAIQPMSDVPAACWLLAAVWSSSIVPRPSPAAGDRLTSVFRGSTISGLCAGMAFLTRPALLPAAIFIGVVSLERPAKESLRYAAILLAFVCAQMFLNHHLYGSARTSGYGPASYMFEISLSRLSANAANFGNWLTRSHSLLIWLAWPAALIVLSRRAWAWKLSAVAAAAAAPYLFYLVFDDWESSRFLLPAILLVLILAAIALGEMLVRFKLALLLAPAALACAAASHAFLVGQDAYRLGDAEAKFPLAASWIETHTPEASVVFAGLHSGSIKYYGHRQTIRWDQIPDDKMSTAIHNLRAAGYELYLALDLPSEPPLFARRFGADSGVQIEQIGRVRVVNFYRFVSTP